MILVDSSVWIDYFNGKITWQTEVLDQMLQQAPVCIGDLIVAEVLQGFRSDSEFRKAREIMELLPCKQMGGCGFAVKAAENYRTLRKKGVTVRKTIDVIIGTFCIIENITLLHDDKDFEPMVEHLALKVVSPPFFA
uniref:type II toxin-antitoxin system VapC family toxin n=1 Tax=Candidatus Electronema sp. TaxID=2698783 RepID=UPI00405787BF